MKKNKPENPSAFPTTKNEYINNSYDLPTIGLFGGMTLRDYFAAKAMQSYINQANWSDDQCSRFSYRIADSMLKQREI